MSGDISSVSSVSKKILKIYTIVLLFLLSMIFPLLIFTLITSFFQGELQFPWEMNLGEKLVISLSSLAITLIAWGISLENLGINNLNKLLRD